MEAGGEEFPFATGQKVESKSNIKGFRGAWFRSEIKYIQIRRGEIWCAMHYTDFPDDKTNFMKAYQQDISGKKKRALMVRPSYPLLCMDNEESVIDAAVGSVVVVNGDWWVGDLVDWFMDGCFWAARITAIISKDIVKVELPSAPVGEGGSYEAAIKDIRPSLDWSVDQLWTVPTEKSRLIIQKTLAVDAPSSSSISPVDALGTLDKERIFIAKQEPAKSTNVQIFRNMFTGLEEVQIKRKSWVAGSGSYSVPDKSNVSDPGPTFAVTSVQDNAMASPKTLLSGVCSRPTDSVCVNHKFVQKKAGLMELAEQGSATSSLKNEQADVVEKDGRKKEPDLSATQINATGKAIPVQHRLVSSSNALNNKVDATLCEELNNLLGDEKCLDVSDERIATSIVALEELLSRVAWLKGVVQLGLKGWCRETKRRKWVFCDREVQPASHSQQEG